MEKIGIFGGTFDPVHNGHLSLAEDAMAQAGLSRVVFIPAGLSPFKLDKDITSGEDRLNMLRLATKEIAGFDVSSYELDEDGVSYTYLTLREMKRQLGEGSRICFITGTDAFLKIEKWRRADELLREYDFLIGSRPGYREEELRVCIDRVRSVYNTEVTILNNRRLDISSTQIRRRIAEGESAEDLLPAEVERYIREKGLYREDGDKPVRKLRICGAAECEELRQRIEPFLREHLKEKRLKHTYGVAETAAALASRWGEDAERAKTAGLFHDMYRGASPEETDELIKKYDLPKRYLGNPDLAHGRLAAIAMREIYGVRDEEMLNAVAYHTTGRAGMTRLEKIIYLADAIEPGREYPGVDELRRLADEDLDAACIACMERSMEYVKERGQILDEGTVRAWEYLHGLKEKEETGIND